MNQKKYQEHRNNEDKTLVNYNPELNQSGAYDSEGNKLPQLIYFFLSSKCNPQRNTRVTNEKITIETGIPDVTIIGSQIHNFLELRYKGVYLFRYKGIYH